MIHSLLYQYIYIYINNICAKSKSIRIIRVWISNIAMCSVWSTVVVGKQGLRCRGACSGWLVASCFGLKGVCMFWNKLMDGHNWQPSKRVPAMCAMRQGSCLNLPAPGAALLALKKIWPFWNHPGGSKTKPPPKPQTKNSLNQPQSTREPEHREEKKNNAKVLQRSQRWTQGIQLVSQGGIFWILSLQFASADVEIGGAGSYITLTSGQQMKLNSSTLVFAKAENIRFLPKRNLEKLPFWKQHHFFESFFRGSQSFCP